MYGLNLYLTNRNRILKRKIKAKTKKKKKNFSLEPVCRDIILIYPLLVIFLVNPLSSHYFPSSFLSCELFERFDRPVILLYLFFIIINNNILILSLIYIYPFFFKDKLAL
ncbi:hypothetical protein NC653_026653 [Populus alba x Populus x berolinensis]|uniref:Uncharacterized protein n=1 Tax=Populus alba x Populus x berolinensis TaxID=444605 RepID=A0AAD6MFK6_9ROSI|nr:hypothetical protein NC653_026653 [Populus alba x Populus x berolinensis]